MPDPRSIDYTIVIPVYRSLETLPALLDALSELDRTLGHRLEVVFVDDGSPDGSSPFLREALPRRGFTSQLLAHARNFGSFAAIRTGLTHARGRYLAAMAADLQEPPSLMIDFFRALEAGEADLTLGVRTGRGDPFLQALPARMFWWAYRRLAQPEMPPGGVDVFGCTAAFRDRLLECTESNSSLVGLLLWLGHRRKLVPYVRLARAAGRSAWTFKRKLRYLSDSIFAFSDVPVRALTFIGVFGMLISGGLGVVQIIARLVGYTSGVPGYAATLVTIVFFACLNSLGLGIIGSYVWRAFENTKGRPLAVLFSREEFHGRSDA